MDKNKLIESAIKQITKDISEGDVTSLEILLSNLKDEDLNAYLPNEGKDTFLNDLELDKLSKVLDIFEDSTVRDQGLKIISGGFASAEYYAPDETSIGIQLKFGVQNDVEDTVHVVEFELERSLLSSDKTPAEISAYIS